jgi:RecA/RadA recombinase
MREVWHAAVSPEAVRSAIWELRQALGENAASPDFVRTVRGHGYTFVGQVAARTTSAPAARHTDGCEGPLFGRDAELSTLRAALSAANDAGGRCVVISGEAGVGKSRLALALRAHAEAVHVTCHHVWTLPDLATPPLWPISLLLEALTRSTGGQAAKLLWDAASGAESLARWPDAHAVDAYIGQRFRMLEQLRRAFLELTEGQSGLLILEDLHWADETSQAFVAHIAQWLAQTRFLLVVTTRTVKRREHPTLHACLGALARDPRNQQLALSNLDRAAVRALLSQDLGHEPSEALAATVYDVSGGNTLFAHELGRALSSAESPALTAQPGADLAGLLRARLEALSNELLETLQAASVWGVRFTLPELAALDSRTPIDALAQVDSALTGGILRTEGGLQYRFVHPLWREAAYLTLGAAQRSMLHRRAGEWLVKHGAAERASELTYHFVQGAAAGCAARAVRHSIDCAEQAYGITAYACAQRHYRNALSALALLGDQPPQQALEIKLGMGEAMRAAATDTTLVNEHFLAIARRADELSDPIYFARAVLGYVGQRKARFTPTRLEPLASASDLALLQRALSALDESAPELRVLLSCSLVHALAHAPDCSQRELHAQNALASAHLARSPHLMGRALAADYYYCSKPWQHEQRQRTCDELVKSAEASGLLTDRISAHVTRAVCALGRGDLTLLLADQRRAQLLAAHLGEARALARSELPSLLLAFCRGDLTQAEELTQRAYASAPEDLVERGLFMLRTHNLRMLRGADGATELAFYENLLRVFPDALGMHCALASAHATSGRREQALEHFEQATQDDYARLPRNATWLNEMALLADAVVQLGERERAAAVYQRLEPYGHVFDLVAAEAGPLGPIAHWLGELSTTLGDHARAQHWLEVSRRLNLRLGATFFLHFGKLAEARALASQGAARARIEQLVADVLAFADESGVRWLRLCAERLRDLVARPRAVASSATRAGLSRVLGRPA